MEPEDTFPFDNFFYPLERFHFAFQGYLLLALVFLPCLWVVVASFRSRHLDRDLEWLRACCLLPLLPATAIALYMFHLIARLQHNSRRGWGIDGDFATIADCSTGRFYLVAALASGLIGLVAIELARVRLRRRVTH